MVFEQILLVGIFFLLFSLLLWGKFRYDLVAFSVLIISVAIGVVPYKNAFDGFVSESSKFQDISVKVSNQASQPINERINKAVETFTKTIAA